MKSGLLIGLLLYQIMSSSKRSKIISEPFIFWGIKFPLRELPDAWNAAEYCILRVIFLSGIRCFNVLTENSQTRPTVRIDRNLKTLPRAVAGLSRNNTLNRYQKKLGRFILSSKIFPSNRNPYSISANRSSISKKCSGS